MPKTPRQLDDEVNEILYGPKPGARSARSRASARPATGARTRRATPIGEKNRYWVRVFGLEFVGEPDYKPNKDTLEEAKRYAKKWQNKGYKSVIIDNKTNETVGTYEASPKAKRKFWQPLNPQVRKDIINQLKYEGRPELIPYVDQGVHNPVAYHMLATIYRDNKSLSEPELYGRAVLYVQNLKDKGLL